MRYNYDIKDIIMIIKDIIMVIKDIVMIIELFKY